MKDNITGMEVTEAARSVGPLVNYAREVERQTGMDAIFFLAAVAIGARAHYRDDVPLGPLAKAAFDVTDELAERSRTVEVRKPE